MKRSCVVLLALVAFPRGTRAAETMLLLPPSGLNVGEPILEAARDIFKGHLMRSGRFTVLTPGGSATKESNPQEAIDAGKAASAELATALHITRLSNLATVRVTVYRVASAEVIHYDDMQAATPDDLDHVLARLADSVVTGKRARQNAEIETVTENETESLRKRNATRSFGVRVGGLLLTERGDTQGVPGFGIFWLYDARSWLADVGIDVMAGNDVGGFGIGVGGYYPFRRGDVTPYLGSALRYSSAEYMGKTANGLIVQPTVGLLLGRLSSVQFRAEFGYAINTAGRNASGPALTLGIGF